MKIVLLSGEYPPQPGGLGDYTRRLGEALAEHGHAVFVATIHNGRFALFDLSQISTQHSALSTQHSDWGWSSYRHVTTALRALQPDVLHIQYQTGAYGMHPAINLLPWYLRRMRDRPRVAVTFHDLLEPYLLPKAGPARRWVTLRLARDADAAVCTNDDDAANLRSSGIVPVVIPIGSNIPVNPRASYERASWRARLGVAENELLVAYFGLLSHSKGVDVLLDALFGAQAPAALAHARLLLVGGEATAPQDRAYAVAVEAQIARLDHRRVIRTGHADERTVSAHLLAADCVALPFRDGASFRRGSLLAALAHGCVVVTTDRRSPTAASAEFGLEQPQLVDGVQALLVPPDDAAALGMAIARVVTDQGLREQLGSAARALAAQFDWEYIARRHEELYLSM